MVSKAAPVTQRAQNRWKEQITALKAAVLPATADLLAEFLPE